MDNNAKIINDNIKTIGVKLPNLRKYAKELRKTYELDYLLDVINENSYQGLLIKGILIGEFKNLSFEETEKYIRYYVSKIADWGVCDTFCCSLKITKKHQKEIWKIIQDYLNSNKEFEVRFALVMILNYYISDEYIESIYKIINNVRLDYYYVKMANAWLISYCVIKYYDETIKFLKNNCVIDKWTYNKGIQKSIESLRITKEQKRELRTLRK